MIKPPNISVIIPCYNTNPAYIKEAVESVKKHSGNYAYEIIIIDDGSTSTNTINYLNNIKEENIKVLFQDNRGPAAARNNGVKNASSDYILFLDSDDRLLAGYINEGLQILSERKSAGVVYANAVAFGDGSRKNFISKRFSIIELLKENYIPMCSIIKKKAWEDVGGIDENLIQYEDWEFWIHIYKAGWIFCFINKPLFEYRIQQSSLIAQLPEENFKKAVSYIFSKHPELVYQVYHQLYAQQLMYEKDKARPARSFIKYLKHKYLS